VGGGLVAGGGVRLLPAIFGGLGTVGSPEDAIGVAFLQTCFPSSSAMNDI